ncbi:hypothetical protein BYT27DRAFT_7050665, partial [Phlegmacium glaucopus]
WVGEYLELEHGRTQTDNILDQIDRLIVGEVKQGRHSKKRTGGDSKVLMKIYLPVLVGFVPSGMI